MPQGFQSVLQGLSITKRQARASDVVELRCFAGLLEAEAADAFVSISTLERAWAFARA